VARSTQWLDRVECVDDAQSARERIDTERRAGHVDHRNRRLTDHVNVVTRSQEFDRVLGDHGDPGTT